MGHTRGWMRCISVCVFMCMCDVCVLLGGGLSDNWPDHLFKPISLHPRSEIKIEYKFIPNLVDFKVWGSLLSLQVEVETINCAGLIFT